MDIYICPMCKQENGEHQKYCLNCGTWLLDPNFPAKKKENIQTKTTKRGFGIVALLVIIGVIWFGLKNGASANKIVFGDVQIGDQYTISQLVVNISRSSISADFTAHKTTDAPLEIAAVFYDGNGTRLGRASALIGQQLSAGQTTTINLDLDEPANLSAAKNVRIEVTPLSPLMMIERAAKKAQEIGK